MNKQLLDQVHQALASQQDTIDQQRNVIDTQNKYLAQRERDIARLTTSLERLAQTQKTELQKLPSLFEDLKISTGAVVSEYKKLMNEQQNYAKAQKVLTRQLITLADKQMTLIQTMTAYQNELPQLDSLMNELPQLETSLSELQRTQSETDSSKSLLMDIQKKIDNRIIEVNKLLNGLESN